MLLPLHKLMLQLRTALTSMRSVPPGLPLQVSCHLALSSYVASVTCFFGEDVMQMPSVLHLTSIDPISGSCAGSAYGLA